jgi:hypothetical protein
MAAPLNTTPAPPSAAVALGHLPIWDPPANLTNTSRWTCECGMAVLTYRYNIYGSAVIEPCPLAGAR